MTQNSSTPDPTHSLLPIQDLLSKYKQPEKNKYVSREFQDFGYRLAAELNDIPHKSLYIRLAKTVDRALLETARSFVIDSNAKSKARLFMWKLKQLRDLKKEKKEEEKKVVDLFSHLDAK